MAPHPNTALASAIHRACDLLIERDISDDVRDQALEHIENAVSLLSNGRTRTEGERVQAFLHAIAPDPSDGHIRPGDSMTVFDASPYSGAANALRPTDVRYVAIENGVEATVTMGTALEGRPGRAHGGATAAIFDDVMGGVQRIIRRSGYTRSLTVDYYAPLPTDEPVIFTAIFTGAESGRFILEGEAKHDGRTIARARGVFTEVSLETFGATPNE